MAVLSFEKREASAGARAEVAEILARNGVKWLQLTYHKTPTVPATLFDIGVGFVRGILNRLNEPVFLLHARSYIAGTMALALQRVVKAPLLFDMRGFWADERVEGGSWSREGPIYRVMKQLERRLFASAAGVVSLTETGREELLTWPVVRRRGTPVEVIPTCADLSRFGGIAEQDRRGPLTIGYLGSMGGRYLIDETVRLFAEIRRARPDARLLVLTPRDQSILWDACHAHDVPSDVVRAEAVPNSEVPKRLAQVSATISLIKPGFSSLASCPTKFGESLAAGCPVVVNPGIGDCASVVLGHRVGVVAELSHGRFEATAAHLLALVGEGPPTRQRCAITADRLFSLETGIDRYAALYSRLTTEPESIA
ncbi:MAG: hypothetical protein IT384_20150 [Deltaproteobacteria bacterium]|nr:hypothetical protein [Deltaproteobacteria bacterium]